MIKFLEDCSRNDVALVGGKGASLGELSKAGKQVPPGFTITVNAYRKFATTTGVSQILNSLSVEGKVSHIRIREELEPHLLSAIIPEEVEDAIRKAYFHLAQKVGGNPLVAVRSSATMEDGTSTSFAGQHETFLNVLGIEDVLDKTLKCWASMFSTHALHYRSANDIPLEEEAMAVVVQKMVNAKASGVAFTVDPVSGDQSKVVIDASWGLGEGIVGGLVTPDHFVVDKESLEITERWISPKSVEVVRDAQSGETIHREVAKEKQNTSCLTTMEIKSIAQIAVSIEKHYGQPQDIEWALERSIPFPKSLLVLQSRPVTVWGRAKTGLQH